MLYASITQFARHWQGVRQVTLDVLEALSGHLHVPVLPGGRDVAATLHHIGAHEYFAARGVFHGRWAALPGEPDADWDAHRAKVTGSAQSLRHWLTQTHALTQQGLREQPELLQRLIPFCSDSIGFGKSALRQLHRRKTVLFASRFARMIRQKTTESSQFGMTVGNPWFDEMPGWLQLHHAYQDEVHHRGQLSVIIRHLGLTPPTLYAEENAEFWNTNKGL